MTVLPREISRLIDQFNATDFKTINEEEARVFYINPFFKALGWAVDSLGGEREVRHGDHVRVKDEGLKSPDYGFYLGGLLQFFVEAKQPSVGLNTSAKSAFQLRRYAWSAGLPVAVLTNFRELAVYDCSVEPSVAHHASEARIHYYTVTEYEDKWEEIAALFSRKAVLEGSLLRLARQERRGTTPVDKAFLQVLSEWRLALAEDIYHRNPRITVAELRYAVQVILDRIVFLRIAEDRGVEDYGRIKALVEGSGVYPRLVDLFQQADDRYNSGLFHFHTDKECVEEIDCLTVSLRVSDSVLRTIIHGLYYPRPYVFSAIPADILGRIYEQLLGSVVSVVDTKVEILDKPEVAKAGGVYYTPKPIVDYMVANTVGEAVKGRTPEYVANLRVIDPACGSGSFLLGAYRYLLDWHLTWYTHNSPEKWLKHSKQPPLFKNANGEICLSVDERKRILLGNIFGADIDPQAVEVTKLSLLLSVLEKETEQARQLKMYHKRALPDLAFNIRQGNSIIEQDDQNTFVWVNEFPQAFKRENPGFDVVIGNPPYVDSEWMSVHWPAWRDYCTEHYASASGNWDLFCVFIELSLRLLRVKGKHSMIVPNKLASADYAQETRKLLAGPSVVLRSIRDYSAVKVFHAAVYPIVYCVSKSSLKTQKKLPTVAFEKMADSELGWTVAESSTIKRAAFSAQGEEWPVLSGVAGGHDLVLKVASLPRLGDLAQVLGAATVAEAYLLSPLLSSARNPTSRDLRVVNSGTVGANAFFWAEKPMRYLKASVAHPVVLEKDQARLPETRLKQARSVKVIVAGMTKQLRCIADLEGNILAAKSTTIVLPKGNVRPEYLAAVINSTTATEIYSAMFGGLKLQGGYLRVGPPQLKKLPIPMPTGKEQTTVAKEIVDLFVTSTGLNEQASKTRVPHEVNQIKHRVEAARQKIDSLVAGLYGLPPRKG
jgi:hypothetical protein